MLKKYANRIQDSSAIGVFRCHDKTNSYYGVEFNNGRLWIGQDIISETTRRYNKKNITVYSNAKDFFKELKLDEYITL